MPKYEMHLPHAGPVRISVDHPSNLPVWQEVSDFVRAGDFVTNGEQVFQVIRDLNRGFNVIWVEPEGNSFSGLVNCLGSWVPAAAHVYRPKVSLKELSDNLDLGKLVKFVKT